MSPTPFNISNSLSYITGQYDYFNMPSTPDILLSQDQILANYEVLDEIENSIQTTVMLVILQSLTLKPTKRIPLTPV
jgi:hypothetical protein